jgi:predicted P-loop ATPase
MIEYFKEGAILPDDKDCRLSLISTWIWEVSEWGTVARRQDREALKAFISTVDVKDRAAYGKHAMQGRAMSSFIATANNEMGLFNDPTGTSRFMTAHVLDIDWKGYTREIDVDQVWAQAYNLWLNKEPWELSDVELAAATEINNDYQMIDIVEETCHQLFEIDPGNKALWMSSLDLMNYLKNDGNLKSGIEIDMRKMASALTKMGLDRPKQKRVAGRIERGYIGIRRLP